MFFFFFNERPNDFNSNIQIFIIMFYHPKEIANLVRIVDRPYSGELLSSELGRLVQNRNRGGKTKIELNLMSLRPRTAHFNDTLQAIAGGETEGSRTAGINRKTSALKKLHVKSDPVIEDRESQSGVK